MSESAEKKRRYNRKLEFANAMTRWQSHEPSKWRIITWYAWVKSMPKKEDFDL